MQIIQAFQILVQNLSQIYDPGEARSIARIVFEDAFRIKNFDSTKELTDMQAEMLGTIQRRLLRHEPVQYILEQADFYGLKFKVTPAVLIPRQETEELVEWMLETIKTNRNRKNLRVLDIGTGSGCMPVTLKKKLPELEVTAIDISPEALGIARENAELNHVEIALHQCNILDKSCWNTLGNFDIIVSNPPYIPTREQAVMPRHVKDFEPPLALFVSDDNPFVFYDAIADFAKKHLVEGGYLFFECNEFNAREVVTLLENKGFKKPVLRTDLSGRDRMIRVKLM